MIRHAVSRALHRAAHAFRLGATAVYESERERSARRWFAADGDRTLRLEYPLNDDSVVFDVGGYEGQWASDIFARYRCTVHVFEPVPEFADRIEARFRHNPKIHVHRVGLAAVTAQREIVLDRNASSLFGTGAQRRTIALRRAGDVLADLHIGRIDLMKVNIEGSEYDLLEDLLHSGLISCVVDLQVQFHDFVPDAARRLMEIQHALSATHRVTWSYPWIWESWTLRPPITCA